MDKYGIAASVIMPASGLYYSFEEGNEEVLAAIRKYPQKLIGMCVVNPLKDNAIVELKKRLDEGMRGLKLYPPSHNYDADNKIVDPLMAILAEREMPVMYHINGQHTSPQMMANLAERNPSTKIIMAHLTNIEAKIEVAARHDNLYIETCTSTDEPEPPHEMLRKAVNTLGSDHILFGTDFPLLYPLPQLGYILDADLSSEDKRKILYLNAKKLFKI
jgi:predicted TIM-barrel fold metal-dependent hydrolase